MFCFGFRLTIFGFYFEYCYLLYCILPHGTVLYTVVLYCIALIVTISQSQFLSPWTCFLLCFVILLFTSVLVCVFVLSLCYSCVVSLMFLCNRLCCIIEEHSMCLHANEIRNSSALLCCSTLLLCSTVFHCFMDSLPLSTYQMEHSLIVFLELLQSSAMVREEKYSRQEES